MDNVPIQNQLGDWEQARGKIAAAQKLKPYISYPEVTVSV